MRVYPRKLLVEGTTDQQVIPYLMEANGVDWPDPPDDPVHIYDYGSASEILKPETAEAELGASGLEALGVVIDADGDASARWDEFRASWGSEFRDLPNQIPPEGLDVFHARGPRLGVWIMPDNRLQGMLEDWLVGLIPDDSSTLYKLAQGCVAEAKREQAAFRDVHKRKAEVYTWLAWQDPPGLQLHEAVNHSVLDPNRQETGPFVNWFRTLFDVCSRRCAESLQVGARGIRTTGP